MQKHYLTAERKRDPKEETLFLKCFDDLVKTKKLINRIISKKWTADCSCNIGRLIEATCPCTHGTATPINTLISSVCVVITHSAAT